MESFFFMCLLYSPEIKKVWENRKTITSNLKEIGLAWDPNKVIKIPNAREERAKFIKKMHGFVEEDNPSDNEPKPAQRPKGFIMDEMEADANALRESNFRYYTTSNRCTIHIYAKAN